jgi:hypothetical protein
MRSSFVLLALPVLLGGAPALAQSGSLAGVTMRVVEDLRGIDAVVLVLELEAAQPGEERAEDAEADSVAPPATEERGEDGREDRREEEGAERRPEPQPPA